MISIRFNMPKKFRREQRKKEREIASLSNSNILFNSSALSKSTTASLLAGSQDDKSRADKEDGEEEDNNNENDNYVSIKEKIIISPGLEKRYEYDVVKDSIISWIFSVEQGDIAFSLIFVYDNGNRQVVINGIRCISSIYLSLTSWKCNDKGKIIIVLSNGFSWFNPKVVHFYLSIGIQKDFFASSIIKSKSTTDAVVRPSSISLSSKNIKIGIGKYQRTEEQDETDTVKYLENVISIESMTSRLIGTGKIEIDVSEDITAKKKFKKQISSFTYSLKENDISLLKDKMKGNVVDILYIEFPENMNHEKMKEILLEIQRLYEKFTFRELGLFRSSSWQVIQIWHICDDNCWIKPSVYKREYNFMTQIDAKEIIAAVRTYKIRFNAINPFGKDELLSTISNKLNISTKAIAMWWLLNHSELDGSESDGIIIDISNDITIDTLSLYLRCDVLSQDTLNIIKSFSQQ